MNASYGRSGGFIGMNQKLEIANGAVHAWDRGRLRGERQLSADETKRLAELVAAAEQERSPESDPNLTRTSDTFTIEVSAGNAHARIRTLNVPYGEGDGSAWGNLIGWLDATLGKLLEGGGESR